MPDYVVYWAIDVEDAKDPEDAARQAKAHFMRRGSIAHIFNVVPAENDGDRYIQLTRDSTLVDLDK